MLLNRYALFFLLWFLSLSIAKPTNNASSEENSSVKKEESDEAFDKQQSKPAGMVDDTLSFPEFSKDKERNKSSVTGGKSDQEIYKDQHSDNFLGPGRYGIPPIESNSLAGYFPVYDNEMVFRKKRKSPSMKLRNEIEDLLAGRQRRRLRMKRQADILELLKNLNTRYYPQEIDEETKESDPIVWVADDEPLVESSSGEVEIIPTWNTLTFPRKDFPYSIYSPLNKFPMLRQNAANLALAYQRRRPLTVNEDSEEDDTDLYDLLDMQEKDFFQDL